LTLILAFLVFIINGVIILKEFDIINQFFKTSVSSVGSSFVEAASVIKGIGDDCAILSVPENHQLVVSMDTLVAGRHFPVDALPDQIATRAFCTCLSDLAAMGAAPRWFTLGLTLPSSDVEWIASFSTALLNIAQRYQCELVGGDTTQGPMTITLQVHGVVEMGKALRRDRAKIGDSVFVTGSLGDGAGALALINNDAMVNDVDEHQKNYLQERFYCPEPQIEAGLKIIDFAHAAVDISDGLLADLQHIAAASEVDISVDVDSIPLSLACKSLVGNAKALVYALSGGDDYQIAFTVPDKYLVTVSELINKEELAATKIGKVVATDLSKNQYQVYCCKKDKKIEIKSILDDYKGYQHFAS
jgi:thiamine-monophosphate kinase